MRKLRKAFATVIVVMIFAAMFSGCKTTEKKYIVLSEDLGTEKYGIGFRNNEIALGLEVQKILDEMIADGTAKTISEKWFGTDIMLKDQEYTEESTAPEGDTSLIDLKARGKLILGLDVGFPPMGFYDENNQIVGFDIDLAKEVAKRLGVELVLQPISWSAKELELSSGKIDCIWNGMTIKPDRVENMFFAKPYIANKQIVIIEENSGIKSIADLKDKIIGLQEGSTSVDALEANPISSQVKEVIKYDDNLKAFSDLKIGRTDAFIVDEVVGRYILSKDQKESSSK